MTGTTPQIDIIGERGTFKAGVGLDMARSPWPTVDTTGSKIILGEHVVLSAGVYIHTHTHQFEKADWRNLDIVRNSEPTTVGDFVFIGVNAQIMYTCKHIGKCSVIGAGSIVTKDVPDYEIWAGNPAVKIGDVNAVL